MDMRATRASMFMVPGGKNYILLFCLISSLFLLWGFCNGMIDIMDKHFQNKLHLTLEQSAWVQFAHYLGYFLMALPAGGIATRLGYKGGIIAGLLMVAAGGLWFLPATHIAQFWAFLIGVCLVASGLTFLETVANPYVTLLGDHRYQATRINLAQTCNGLGWVLGPIAGSLFFYSEEIPGPVTGHETLYVPYVGVSVVVLILAVVFAVSSIPDIQNNDTRRQEDATGKDSGSLWSHSHFTCAVVAQFLYVAAQAGIFSFFINYMTSQVPAIPETWNAAVVRVADHGGLLQTWLSGWFRNQPGALLTISDKGAANLASIAFALFVLGRVIGAGILTRTAPHTLLALFGAANVTLSLLIFFKLGWLSVASVFGCYLFMSIMFPTIFALGIHGLGEKTKRASAYLVMAIIGGAIVPKLMGAVADHSDMSRAFIVPMICFAFISYYGFRWPFYSRTVPA